MIEEFSFAQMPALEFGWDITKTKLADQILARTLAEAELPIMLVASKFVAENLVFSRFSKIKAERKIHQVIVSGEPSVNVIDELVKNAPKKVSLVIGFGGGSVLDAAKAIAGLLPERYSVQDYLEGVGTGRKLTKQPVDFIAIPTTAGTGSETTKNAVIGKKGEFKKSFRDERLLAKQAWLDPALLVNCPKPVLYATAMDALTQLIESFVTLKANPYTDALALKGIELFKNAIQQINSSNEESQKTGYSALMLAANLSGTTLANAGLGAVHGLAGPIGAYFEAPHGVVCARLLAPITELNLESLRKLNSPQANKTLQKYQQLAQVLTGVASETGLVSYLKNLTNRLEISGLANFDINAQNVEQVIATCRAGSMLGNPVVLTDGQLLQAIKLAI